MSPISCKSNPKATKPRMNPIDSSELDPRPPPPYVKNPCCACRPSSPQPQMYYYGLKLKQLENCYKCRVSDACYRRADNVFTRWVTYLDRLPVRYPNTDYTEYCCDNYYDQSTNKDFDRYAFSYFKKDKMGQRRRAHRNFLWPGTLGQSLAEMENDRSRCNDPKQCPCKCANLCKFTDLRELNANTHRVYHEEGYSRWHQKQLAPNGFTETATPVKSRCHPFRKDASFSTPLDQLATGNESPFKEIRAFKMM